jgi:hypothetical protein
MGTYEYMISDDINDEDALGTHQSQYQEYKTKMKQLEKLLEYNRNEQVGQN